MLEAILRNRSLSSNFQRYFCSVAPSSWLERKAKLELQAFNLKVRLRVIQKVRTSAPKGMMPIASEI